MIASRLLRVVSVTILAALLSGVTVRAQTIVGVVAEESSGEGLAGAVVLLFDDDNTERGAVLTQPLPGGPDIAKFMTMFVRMAYVTGF